MGFKQTFCGDGLSSSLSLSNTFAVLLAVTNLSIALSVTVNFTGELSKVDAHGALVAAVVLTGLSFLFGIWGLLLVVIGNPPRFSVYVNSFTLIGVAISFLVVGSVLSSQSNEFDAVRDGLPSSSLQKDILDLELAVLERCCNIDGFSEVPIFACDSEEGGGEPPCVSDETFFFDVVDLLDNDFCKFLRQVDLEGSPVVGNLSEGGCGSGNALIFVNNLGRFLQFSLKRVAISNLVSAVLILLCSLSVLYELYKSIPGEQFLDDDKDRVSRQPVYSDTQQEGSVQQRTL